MNQGDAYRWAQGVPTFDARVILAEGETEQPCRVAIEEHAVAAVVADRVVAWISLADLRLEAGGFEADFIFARGPVGYPSIATRDRGFEVVLRQRAASALPSLRAALDEFDASRKRQKSWRGVGVALLASIFGLN